MTTNLQNKTILRVPSLEVRDSKQIVNRNGSKATSALISQREISVKTNNSIKGNGLGRKLVQRKDTTPGQANKEVEKLAKAWCGLLLNQMQEA
ncbi:hypothetical protein HY439_03075 [Candidatus Microgenomates bacterium]|nr:hypothetical protein [Candidatus Microgenomates bacterium]